MNFNWLGVVAFGIVILGAVIASISTITRKSDSFVCSLTTEENTRYNQESIAIQPSNNPIFKDKQIGEVVADGMSLMKKDHYNMLEGVDKDV